MGYIYNYYSFRLLSEDEVIRRLLVFHEIIHTQFDAKMRILHGIILQKSCVKSSEQHRVAEKKNRHLLEIARPLLFTMHMGDAVLAVALLINRVPSKVFGNVSPISLFKYTYIPSLSPKS